MDANSMNNMKVADLKRELRAKGLSLVGNKSELVARLQASIATDSLAGDKDEDEYDVLGSDILDGASDGDPKADDALIDDLLGNGTQEGGNARSALNTANETNNNSVNSNNKNSAPPTVLKRISLTPNIKISGHLQVTAKTAPSTSKIGSSADETADAQSVLKTGDANALTAAQRLALRAQKFGDNKLSVRAERFGTSGAKDSEAVAKSVAKPNDGTEQLKKRAERFGAVVSATMKKIDQKEKLLKRKQRFGAVITSANIPANTGIKRVITTTKDDEKKKQRLERFGAL